MSRNVSARSDWSDEVAPDRIDRDAFLYMGADPCWTPATEFKSAGGPDPAAGDCMLCGGDGVVISLTDGTSSLHRDIPAGSRRVCARCMRYGRERLAGSDASAPSPDDPEVPVSAEPGYVTRGGVTVPERFARLLKG